MLSLLFKNVLRILVIISVFPLTICAQSDTLSSVPEEDSVVYVYEDPVIIKQTITKKEEVFQKWFLDITAAVFQYSDDHLLCSQFTGYKNIITQCTKPSGGFSAGGKLMYNSGILNYSAGFSWTTYTEKFQYINNNINGTNKYSYVDLNSNIGMWLFRKKKYVSLMPNGGLILSRLMQDQGYTISYTDLSQVITNKAAGRDADWVGSAQAGLKIIFLNNMPVKIYIEPYTRVNFTSTLYYKENYYLRRWACGIQAGIFYTF